MVRDADAARPDAGRRTCRTSPRCRATSGATCATGRSAAALTALTVDDLVARARGGDAKALAALLATARYLGLGLGSVVNAIDPAHVYIGGEITAAWDLIEADGPRRARRARA